MTPTVAVITTLGSVLGAVLLYLGARFTGRSARAASREDRDASELQQFRANAEAHLPWDGMVVGAVRELRREVNGLRIRTGEDAREWEALPDPPPLFPRASAKT